MIPLVGQGEPLPADCPYTGEWLHKDKLFLYQPSGEQLQRLELTASFKRADGEWCLGFNAVILASELGAWNEEIFEHNRTRTLILEVVGPAPPNSEGRALRFTFSVSATGAPFSLLKWAQRVQPDCQRIRIVFFCFSSNANIHQYPTRIHVGGSRPMSRRRWGARHVREHGLFFGARWIVDDEGALTPGPAPW